MLDALGVRVAGERVTVGGSVTVGVRVSVALGVGNACAHHQLIPRADDSAFAQAVQVVEVLQGDAVSDGDAPQRLPRLDFVHQRAIRVEGGGDQGRYCRG